MDDRFSDFLREMEQEMERSRKRPRMLAHAAPYYDRELSRIPDRIRVSFEDGTTAVYDLHVDAPTPVFEENIRIIRKWKRGYPPRRRRR